MTQALAKPYTQVTSDDLRAYLAEYEQDVRPERSP